LSPELRESVESFLDERVELGALIDSPAYNAMRYLEGDRFDVRKLRNKLGNSHNVRIFAARAGAALAEYLDPEHRKRALQAVVDRRYFMKSELTALFLADAVAPHRTFDQGNTKVVSLLQGMVEGVVERIRASEELWLVLPELSGTIAEGDSKTTPQIAAADIASRIAGDLYRSENGLRKVVERFRMVVLNGAVVPR
jgi:hypothetical protein